MKLEIVCPGELRAAYIRTDRVIVGEPSDALELLEVCYNCEVRYLIMEKAGFSPDFFELRTGLAGDILQKFSQYGHYLAVIGDFSTVGSRSLRDFIRESNLLRRILFVPSVEDALEKWRAGGGNTEVF